MDIERRELQKPEFKFDGKYCGGHKAYPVRKEIKAKFVVFPKRMEITTDRFVLPVRFDQVKDIRNVHQKKIYPAAITLEKERIKRKTIQNRRLLHHKQAA